MIDREDLDMLRGVHAIFAGLNSQMCACLLVLIIDKVKQALFWKMFLR